MGRRVVIRPKPKKNQPITPEKIAEDKANFELFLKMGVFIGIFSILIDRLMPMTWFSIKVSLMTQSRVYLGVFFIYMGYMRFGSFINDMNIVKIPPFLTGNEKIYRVIGTLELLFGIGIFVGFPLASYGVGNLSIRSLIVLLWTLLPAHIYCVVNSTSRNKLGMSIISSLIRLFIQIILIGWAYVHTDRKSIFGLNLF